MESLLAIGAVQSIFLALVTQSKKPKSKADRVLLAALLFWALRFISYWLITQGYHSAFPHITGIAQTLFLLDGPLVYLYVSCFTVQREVNVKNYVAHFLPFVLIAGYSIILFAAYSPGEMYEMLDYRIEGLRLWNRISLRNQEKFFIIALCVSLVTYAVLSLRLVYIYQRRIKDNFSYTEKINLDWLKIVIWIWAAFFVLPFTFFLVNFFGAWLPVYLTDLPLILGFMVVIFVPGYYALKYPNQSIPLEEALHNLASEEAGSSSEEFKDLQLTTPTQYQKSGLKTEHAEGYAQKLRQYIEKEQPYLNSDWVQLHSVPDFCPSPFLIRICNFR